MDERRRRDGRRAPRAAAVGRAVPPRVDLHRRRAPAARELPRPDRAASAARRPRGRMPLDGAAPRQRPPPSQRPAARAAGQRLDRLYDPEQVFVHLFGDEPHAFWLDSSKGRRALAVLVHGRQRRPAQLGRRPTTSAAGEVQVARGESTRGRTRESIFDYLDRELRRLRDLSDDLPFDLNCGFVGYFGYELKADCEGDLPHRSSLPDAAFVFADRLIAFDHSRSASPTSVPHRRRPARPTGERWVDETSRAPRRACRRSEPVGAGRRAAEVGRVPPEPRPRAVPRRHPARARTTSPRARATRSA